MLGHALTVTPPDRVKQATILFIFDPLVIGVSRLDIRPSVVGWYNPHQCGAAVGKVRPGC
jgi:hypothetical protein